MKKMISLFLSLLLIMTLVACGTPAVHSPDPSVTPSDNSSQSQSATTPDHGNKADDNKHNLVSSDLTPSEGLAFESNGDGTCTLVGIGTCHDTDIVIPTKSPEGDTLTLIQEYAFVGLEDVESITLLNYEHEVDAHAFQYGEMTAVHIIGGTPIIGESAFSSCEKLTAVTFTNCAPQVDEYAFFSCGKDAAVTFSNCTGTLDKRSFQYGDLASVTIEQCDLVIEESAFASCEDLTSITCTDSTLQIAEYAFLGIGDPDSVTMTDCELLMDDRAFQYASLSDLTISGKSVEIGDSAFSSCEDLTTVTIDSPSVVLGEYAFLGCEDLTSVSICDNKQHSNAITIDDRAFQYCSNLSSVTIGQGTVDMGKNIFSACSEELFVSVAGKPYTE